jgi:hypothetical protein
MIELRASVVRRGDPEALLGLSLQLISEEERMTHGLALSIWKET